MIAKGSRWVRQSSKNHPPKLIDLQAMIASQGFAPLFKGLFRTLEKLLSISDINAIHQSTPSQVDIRGFCRTGLEALNVDYAVTEQELNHVPAKGPLVMVANHPFGGIEGIILTEVLLHIRPDVRILGNYLLTRIPALASHIIPVDPFNPKKSAASNARSLKQAMDWVCSGGALLAFPSGEVAHFNLKTGKVADPPWSPHIAKLVLKAKAKVLPVHIHGRNTLFFNTMGWIHPRLRTILLPREMVNKRGAIVQLTMGRPIAWPKLADFASAQRTADFLRFNTNLLKHRNSTRSRWRPLQRPLMSKGRSPNPIIAPVSKARLTAEIEALPQNNRLVIQKEFSVYITTADQSPGIMREIARLRETSFRDVDEGTGRSLDMDTYDAHYLQLFLWNNDSRQIVGAYRIGRSDEILKGIGPSGLYSTTLFSYKPRFIDQLCNTLELGRSFIRTEYRKKFGCLAILWRGIGEFVARNCYYRYLFGPVSISREYHTISRNLMVAFLIRNTMDPELSAMVKPRKPVRIRKSINRSTPPAVMDKDAIEEISMLVSEIEKDNKGVPTLIKHYLKLNGRFLAFNLDKAFANVIDGLVWVDLLKTDQKIIARFMGTRGSQGFHAFHSPETITEAA